jgi:N-acetylglucosaminyldiphosphoundecaprenol N-acetyl-beta-D-mannosaminyltransferase
VGEGVAVDGVEILGARCFVGTLDDASERLLERARVGQGGYVCQANAHVLVTACHDPRLRRALDDAWAVHPDGSSVSWLARRLGARHAARIAGAELMLRLFQLGEPVGLRHYLFGSTPEVIERLGDALSRMYPRARIVGAVSPPFGDVPDERALADVEAIHAVAPEIVWVGLGAPKQELWMSRYAPHYAPAVAVGVGAAFDFIAGTKQRAPEWMQRRGLEWAHRLWSEPGRLAGRYLRTNSEFVVRAMLDIAAARRAR